MSDANLALAQWAQRIIGRQVDQTSQAIKAFCDRPDSVKRLHRTRKRLARLQAALEDLAPIAGVAGSFSERIRRIHRRAGKVRDADVLLARVEKYCEDASEDELEQLHRLRKLLRKRARKHRRKLRAELKR
jgi:CHAD domain-containing protein